MSLALLALGFLAFLAASYRLYGGWVRRRLDLDDARATPAVARKDGVDYVPAKPFYLFAQHFSAIAAAGPIAGPILACQAFGWLPCLVWIALGVVLIGAVHDFATLALSVRHGGRSIADVASDHLGRPAGRAMLAFIWIALVYVIIAFTNITSNSFVSGTEELAASGARFNPGGAVAAASAMYLGLAIVMGLVQRFLAPPLWLLTVIFVPGTFGVAWLGTQLSEVLVHPYATWAVVILVYCAVASVTPVWALLQPRGYLGGFVLYSALALGVLGALFGGYEVRQEAFKAWQAPGATGALFPFLFVTIACGACSGFHGLVCSGTTSKQVEKESHMHLVGYGAMLAEGFVALIALTTVIICAPSELTGLAPGTIYGNGIGRFLTLLIGEENLPFAVTFGAMAFSTFVFDTLDVCTRLGRYIVQELFGWTSRAGALVGTLATIALPAVLATLGGPTAYLRFWTLFGASNQLLAALTLLVVSLWLRKRGKGVRFTLLPMAFVLAITVWALVDLSATNFAAASGDRIALANGIAAAVLVALALFLAATGLRRLAMVRPGALQETSVQRG